MKQTLLALTLATTAILSTSTANIAVARDIIEDSAGGYDFAIMSPIKIEKDDLPAILGRVTNQFSELLTKIEDLSTFEAMRFDGERKAIFYQGDDRTMMVLIGYPVPERARTEFKTLFPDIEEGDFDAFNQGLSFSARTRERNGEEQTSLALALLGNPDARAPVAVSSADRIRVRINDDLEMALPPDLSMLSSTALDRTGKGFSSFTASVEYSEEDVIKYAVDAFREAGIEPVVNKKGDTTGVGISGDTFNANLLIQGDGDEAIIQGTFVEF